MKAVPKNFKQYLFFSFSETNDDHHSEDSEGDPKDGSEDPGRKWPEDRKSGRTNMADRPLPVPVENEPYYMNVDRAEAQNLLKGQPDGTFILRPSSQVGFKSSTVNHFGKINFFIKTF